jgi:hypothetical protein
MVADRSWALPSIVEQMQLKGPDRSPPTRSVRRALGFVLTAKYRAKCRDVQAQSNWLRAEKALGLGIQKNEDPFPFRILNEPGIS